MFSWGRKIPEPETSAPILDLGYVTRLSEYIGHDETVELLADGMLELSDRLARLPELARSEDIETLLSIVHDIAGASGHLGLSAMSKAAVESQRRLRTSPHHVADTVAEILALREASIEALGKFCKEKGEG